MSERGRRNSGRRRVHGGARGAIHVWSKHTRNRACQCAECLIARVRRLRAALAQSVARAQILGAAEPTSEQRKRVQDYEDRVRNALKTKGIVIDEF